MPETHTLAIVTWHVIYEPSSVIFLTEYYGAKNPRHSLNDSGGK